MTYKNLFPKVVERDRNEIKDTVAKTQRGLFLEHVCNARIEALLEDAFLRGRTHGIDTVLEDPSAYDLFAKEGGE